MRDPTARSALARAATARLSAGSLLPLLLTAGCFPAPAASASAKDDPAPPVATAGALSLLVEPDDGPNPILSFIRDARRSLDVEVYLLTADEVIQALIDLQGLGRPVRVLLEPHPFGADGANQAAYDALAAAGVTVGWTSPRFALTHAKIMLADGQRALVMSLNLTHAGLFTNREYAIVDADATDVVDAAAIFADDRLGIPAPTPTPWPAGRLLASPANARAGIADLIATARRTIAIEIEELSDTASVDALVAAVGRGVAVSVVLPGADRAATTTAAASRLAAAGATVRALVSPAIHAKAIVVDGARLYTGSVNLTAASLDDNRELGLRDDDPIAAGRVARTIAADWARASEL